MALPLIEMSPTLFADISQFNSTASGQEIQTEEKSERDIVLAAQRGDHFAFNALYTRYSPRVYNRVRSSVPSDDVEDIVQEVFLAAVRALPGFDGRSSFSTWLGSITSHKIVDFYRRKPKQATVPLAWQSGSDGPYEGLSHMLEPISEEQDSHDDRLLVRSALARLPGRYREVLLLRLAADLGFAQIASRLKLTEEASRSLFRRAVVACRQALEGA